MPDISKLNLTYEHRLEVLIQLLDEKGIIAKEEVLEWLQKTVKEKAQADTSEKEEWMNLMQALDTRMPRNVEDIYDALILYGLPLENFPPFVQEAYKAKKEARSKKPNWDIL